MGLLDGSYAQRPTFVRNLLSGWGILGLLSLGWAPLMMMEELQLNSTKFAVAWGAIVTPLTTSLAALIALLHLFRLILGAFRRQND